MKSRNASLALTTLLLFFACRKPSTDERSMISEAATLSSDASVAAGASHESFDRIPLDLNWTVEYKPNANAFKIVQDNPKIGPGTGKFILYPDAIIGGKNRSQMSYSANHPLGAESTYSFYVRIPNYWADRPANNDIMLATWNASPDPSKGETWATMPITEPLAQIRYHAEGGKSYFQLWQGLNTVKLYEGKIWTQPMIGQSALVKENWYKLTLKMKWSTGNDGYITATINDQPWVSKTAVRTMANPVPAYFKVGLARPVPANLTDNIVSAFFDDVNISAVEPNQINPKVIAQNLQNPWELAWGPDNYIYFTGRTGTVSRINPSTGAITKLITLTDCKQAGTGGLLGLVLHPQFLQQPYVYITYDYDKAGKYTQKVVRYTYSANKLISPLIVMDNIAVGAPDHHGSRLMISDNFLYITTGDGGGGPDGKSAQDLKSLSGKVLRVNLDGSVPPTNPYPASAIWSYGFRNSQGLVYANGKIYTSEHGPDNDDEINIIEKGRNYGWPIVMGYCDQSTELSFCSAQNVRQPIKAWTPTIAPSGIDYYSNAGAIAQWRNSLLVCTLKNMRLMQLKLSADGSSITDTKEFFTNTYGRLRDICISPQGKVYLCTDNGTNDKIIEISPQ